MKKISFLLILLLATSLVGMTGCKNEPAGKVKPAPSAVQQTGQK
jgi:hypothetical protein